LTAEKKIEDRKIEDSEYMVFSIFNIRSSIFRLVKRVWMVKSRLVGEHSKFSEVRP
jgi:hypothetical protein